MNINVVTSNWTERFSPSFVHEQVTTIFDLLGLDKDKRVYLDIIFSDEYLYEDVYGLTDGTWDGKYFDAEIEIKSGLSVEDFVSTLAHELTHVKQYYFKELNTIGRVFYWRGQKFGEDYDYLERPWEKEAYDFEEKYLHVFNKDL